MITNNNHHSLINLNTTISPPTTMTSQTTHQPLNQDPTISSHSNRNTILSHNIQNLISFTTLNTRGLNEITKLKILTNSVSSRSIFFCTETKLKKDTTYPRYINGKSIIYGNSISAKNGTALIIGEDLSSHVHKIIHTSEYCSSIILKFKGKVDILVTALYLPHDKKERKTASNLLRQSIKKASTQRLHHIILGDFNSFPKNSTSIGAPTTPGKQSIYRYLNNYIDIGHHFGENKFTHFTHTSASRIDQVWVSKNLAPKVIWYKVDECDIIPTDHRAVSIKLDWFEFKKTQTRYKFDIGKTSQENITNFTKDIDLWTSASSPTTWEEFSDLVKISMNKFIKKTKINISRKSHYTVAEKTLRTQTRKINKALKHLKKNKTSHTLDDELMTLYHNINQNTNLSVQGLRRLKRLLIKEGLAQAHQELLEEYHRNLETAVEDFYNKPKNYINRALGAIKPKLDLSRVYNTNGELEEDPDLIKDAIAEYFQNILQQRPFNLTDYPDWQEAYRPLNINQEIYKETLSTIDHQILLEAIKNLPKNKAPGKSEISYDIIKLLGKGAIEPLCSIFNSIIQTTTIPKSWKQTITTLIPKKVIWSHNLNDTRPISLVDSTRKLLTGIINKRLTKILKSNKVLSDLNFAGLPGQSTLEPLTIVNSAIMAANANNKEFWFASLDIAKAFDSAPIQAIQKSFERINCPNKLTQLVINLFSYREVSINTPSGPTNPFLVNNGIEQGETLSPITWVIFYDPLITKLSKHTKVNSYLAPNALAYMDDLALIADNKIKLEILLKTANQFFQINSLKCNKDKTKIINNIPIKNNYSRQVMFDGHNIQVLKPKESIKYLGIQISPHNMLKSNRKTFEEMLLKITTELTFCKWKGEIKQKISEWVILGKFEYFLITSHLNKTLLTKLQRKINKMLKTAYRISSTCSNLILASKSGLNLSLLEERQRTSLIGNLITKLSTPSINKYLHQDIESIQRKEAIWYCPLCNPDKFRQDCWILSAAHAAQSIQIQICPPICPFSYENASNSIGFTFRNLKGANKKSAIRTVNALNIKFTNQLLRLNSNIKLSWSQLASHTGLSRCGPEPIWFKNFQNSTKLKGTHGPIPNPKPLFWIIHPSQIIVKTHKRTSEVNANMLLKGRHFLTDSNNNLIKCRGCSLGFNRSNSCSIIFSSTSASSLWTTCQNSSSSKYHLNNLIEEIHNTPQQHETILQNILIPQTTPTPPQLSTELGLQQLYSIQAQQNDIIVNETKISAPIFNISSTNILLTIYDIIQWCPNLTIIEIRDNRKILQEVPSTTRRMVKINHSSIISRINLTSSQKSISIQYSRPKSKPRIIKSIHWNIHPIHLSENPKIGNLNIGSSTIWSKKVLHLVKTYMICESSSVIKTFGETLSTHGLEVLTKSSKRIRVLKNNTYSDLIAFRIKLLSGTLPTRAFLNQFYPELYPDELCPRCEFRKENIKHVFECFEAKDKAAQIITSVNNILNPDNNTKPISHIWQVAELSCGITNNIHSVSSTDNWVKAATESLSLLYNLIWKPRSCTANTSATTGIKWKETIRPKTKNSPTSQQNQSNLTGPDNTSTTQEEPPIDLPTLVANELIQSKFKTSTCFTNLITNHNNILLNNLHYNHSE